jgi:hypothetical protein
MTLETRLRDCLRARRDAVPARSDAYGQVVRAGRRHQVWRRTRLGVVGAAALTAAVVVPALFISSPAAVAVSPITGRELPVLSKNPMVLLGQLGPAPDVSPGGVDLTPVPIEEPEDGDLAAVAEVVDQEGYTAPVTVALGEIEAVDTRVFVVHDVDPATRSGRSTVVAIGPTRVVAYSGSTEQGTWGMGGGRSLDGDGWVAMRVPDFASYVQVDVDGTIVWQRPADGFILLPFTARSDQDVVVTGHDHSGRVFLRKTLEALVIMDSIEEARAAVTELEARIVAAEQDVATGEGGDELARLMEAHAEAVRRLDALERELDLP